MKRKGANAFEAPNLKRFRDDVKDLVLEHGAQSGSIGAQSLDGVANSGVSRKERRLRAKKEKKLKRRNHALKKCGESPIALVDKVPKKPKKKKKRKTKSLDHPAAGDEETSWESQARDIRNRQLQDANMEEDRTIRRLEKNLGLKKRKNETTVRMPNAFKMDGLDFLLDLCEEATRDAAVEDERKIEDEEKDQGGDGTSADLELCLDEKDSEGSISDGDVSDDVMGENSEDEMAESEEGEEQRDTYEDIYGRLRDLKTKHIVKDNRGITGDETRVETKSEPQVVIPKPGKYVPPSLRKAMSEDEEKLVRLQRQIKGSLNRLSETNILSIVTAFEDLYCKNSRNSVTKALTETILSACTPSTEKKPSRFLLEHGLLLGALHQIVGPQVGGEVLQRLADIFNDYIQTSPSLEDKRADNATSLLCGLYVFKVVHGRLIFDLLRIFSQRFLEKDIELILLVFRTIGFFLRKDDPSELKTLLADLQRRAVEAKSSESSSYSKIQFMLDVLLAVKNNNVTKVPNYDAETPEKMLKVLKVTLSAKQSSKGENSLRVSFAELIDADARGKWWIVGGAWEGRSDAAPSTTVTRPTASNAQSKVSDDTLAKIDRLASRQRINTQLRKSIFTILLTAEDYVDAFQSLLKLNLNEKQERDIVYVLGSACLHEKTFNSYYALLAQKFCNDHPRFRVTFKYWLWDKYRELASLSEGQAAHLGRLYGHLFLHGELSLAALKIVEFYKMEGKVLIFMKTALTRVLCHENEKVSLAPFGLIATPPKLSVLRQSLLLFVRHFLVEDSLDDAELLKKRIESVAAYLKKR